MNIPKKTSASFLRYLMVAGRPGLSDNEFLTAERIFRLAYKGSNRALIDRLLHKATVMRRIDLKIKASSTSTGAPSPI